MPANHGERHKSTAPGQASISPFLNRWNVVIAAAGLLINVITLGLAIWVFIESPVFRAWLDPSPDLKVNILESNGDGSWEVVVSNAGSADAAVRRIWLTTSDDQEPVRMNLKNQNRLLEPGKAYIYSGNDTIPAWVEEEPNNANKTCKATWQQGDMTCHITLEAIFPDGSAHNTLKDFRCANYCAARRPPDVTQVQ